MGESIRAGESESPRELTDSLFLLRKSSSSCTASIQVDFASTCTSSATTPTKTLPVFHRDGCFYTPAFVLPSDQPRYADNSELYHSLHIRKTAQMAEQKTDLFVSKPSKNNSFCCVCRSPFDDYLTHVNLPKHQLLMKKSDYHDRITELCAAFVEEPQVEQSQKKRRGRPMKVKPIRKLILKKMSSKDTSCEESVKEEALCMVSV